MSKLNRETIEHELGALSGWQLQEGAIGKRFALASFPAAIAFVNQVAELAEAADHHPDFAINYTHVTLSLSTHSEGGVTEKDLDLARQIERLALPAA